MFYLLWLALKKVQDRQTERNQTFINYGREDRVLKCPDFTEVLTNFIDWHLEDIDNNKFDGKYLKETPRIAVCDQIKAVGQVKEGWAIKIYKYLTKDVQVPSEAKVSLPNYKHQAFGLSLDSLTVDDMKVLLQKENVGIFAQLKENNKEKLEEYLDNIVKFVEDKKLDGTAFLAMKRNAFRDDIQAYLVKVIGESEDNKKKIKKCGGTLLKLHGAITNADLNKIMQ